MIPYYQDKWVTIYHGDCREILPQLDKVDLVLTDPPYEIGNSWLQTFYGSNGRSILWGEKAKWDTASQEYIDLILAIDAEKVIWGANNYATPPTATWLVWDKKQKTNRAEAELAWSTLSSGNKIFRMSRIDAYFNRRLFPKQHPTEKPWELFVWCIELFSNAAIILDPFLGAGTTAVAAKKLNRKCIGIEIEERYCEIAANRCRQMVMEMGI